MTHALFAGSFHPFTVGHADIVVRGLNLFDEITIGVGLNADKPLPDAEALLQKIRALYAHEPRVHVEAYDTLTVTFAKKIGATALLRGVRSVADYEYERQMADANRAIGGLDTVLLFSKPELSYISSSLVRDLQGHGLSADAYIAK